MNLHDFEALVDPHVLAILRETPVDTDPARFVMDHARFSDLPVKAMAEQLDLRRRASEKFPEWKGLDLIYTRKALEQSSGPVAARHKSKWMKGKVVDLCGGLGADLIHNRAVISYAVYCEIDPLLCQIFSHNAKILGFDRYTIKQGDGIEFLKSQKDGAFDLVYADPDRRSADGRRTPSLLESSPDVVSNLELLKAKGKMIMVKASPALDPTEAEKNLSGLDEYVAVSVEGEVKEVLLFVSDFEDHSAKRTAVLLKGDHQEIWKNTGKEAEVWNDGEPKYLAEPDPAIIRAGLVSEVAARNGLKQASYGSVYLLGHERPSSFPGRVLEIKALLPANFRSVKRWCKENDITAANIARRDFPQPTEALRKALKLKDGGEWYLFFLRKGETQACVVCQRCTETAF